MTDPDIFDRINALCRPKRSGCSSRPATAAACPTDDVARLEAIKVELDRAYDLLHQRQAKRAAGLDPSDAEPRPADIVEHYQQ